MAILRSARFDILACRLHDHRVFRAGTESHRLHHVWNFCQGRFNGDRHGRTAGEFEVASLVRFEQLRHMTMPREQDHLMPMAGKVVKHGSCRIVTFGIDVAEDVV